MQHSKSKQGDDDMKLEKRLLSAGFAETTKPDYPPGYRVWEILKPLHGTLTFSYRTEVFYCPKVKLFLNGVCILFGFGPAEPVIDIAVMWAEGNTEAEE